MRFLEALAVGTALALAWAGAAQAQLQTRSNSPIDITADQAEVIQSHCEAIWSGAAEAIQDQSRLRADTIRVFSKPKPTAPGAQAECGNAERIEADGHVFYVTPERNARGDHAVYTQANDQIVMTGDVIVVQGQDVARGAKLIIDVASHQARMVSDTAGAGQPGRVRGVYFPDKPATPAPGATPATPER